MPIGFGINENVDGSTQPKAMIINATRENNMPLTGTLYDTSVEEGITLFLLRNHNMREIEVILSYLLEDDDAIEECLDRLKGFTRALF